MKRFRLFLAAFALTLSSAAFANPNSDIPFDEKKGSISHQIEKMLSDSRLFIEDDFTVTVIFRMNEEKRIEIKRIDSPNEELNVFLTRRLENQKLHGDFWDAEKIYKLPVKVQADR